MTKTQKKQEVTRMFHEFIDSKGFIAHDEGHGYWYVHPKNNGFSTTMFQVTRKFEVDTFGCESEHVLEFADILKEKLNEYMATVNL
jgi:hypothetical protein